MGRTTQTRARRRDLRFRQGGAGGCMLVRGCGCGGEGGKYCLERGVFLSEVIKKECWGGEGRAGGGYRLRGRHLGERWSGMPLDIVSEVLWSGVWEKREAYRHLCKYVLC